MLRRILSGISGIASCIFWGKSKGRRLCSGIWQLGICPAFHVRRGMPTHSVLCCQLLVLLSCLHVHPQWNGVPFLVCSPVLTSVPHNHIDIFWSFLIHDTFVIIKWGRSARLGGELLRGCAGCAPPRRKGCAQNWKQLPGHLVEGGKTSSNCLHLPEEILGMYFPRSLC